MIAHGDIESVNLSTGEQSRRVSGDGEFRLEVAMAEWREWAEQREADTTWRRYPNGTPNNMPFDQFCFLEGFRKGIEHALPKRP